MPDPLPTLTAWADEPTILDRAGRPALVCWWRTTPPTRAGVVWPSGAWAIYAPDCDPCGGAAVESGAADDVADARIYVGSYLMWMSDPG